MKDEFNLRIFSVYGYVVLFYFTNELECGTLYEIWKSMRSKRLTADEYGKNRQACI